MEFAFIVFLVLSAIWTSQTLSPPKKEEKKKTAEQELTEAIGKYLATGSTQGFEFNLKIHRDGGASQEPKPEQTKP